MKLSDHFTNVIRDAVFDCIGIISNFPGKLMLTFAEDKKYINAALKNRDVAAIICFDNIAERIPENIGVVLSDNPRRDIFLLHNKLCDDARYIGNRFASIIPASCKIHPSAVISEHNVVFGENVTIEEFVSIKDGVTIGNNCVIRTGTVIGATEFEVKRFSGGTFVVNHVGKTIIGDHVEIQNNSIIGKGVFPFQATTVDDYTVIGSFVDFGHGSSVGKRTLITNGSKIAGSCEIGNDVWISASIISSQVKIGDGARISIGSVVYTDVKPGQTVTGNPAVDHKYFLRNFTRLQSN